MNRSTDSGVVFLLQLYMDDRERIEVLGNLLMSGNQELVWSIHDEDEAKAHCHVLVRVPFSMTISAFSKRYGARERLIQLCGRDEEHKNYKGGAVYLLHADKKSRAEGKHLYNETSLYGPWKNHILSIIKKREKYEWRDEDIQIILDHIDKQEFIRTADLVRWACSAGIYSIFRRNISIIRDCIRQHNDLFIGDSSSDYVAHQVLELSRRLNESEKKIAYLQGVARRPKALERPVNVAALRQLKIGDNYD